MSTVTKGLNSNFGFCKVRDQPDFWKGVHTTHFAKTSSGNVPYGQNRLHLRNLNLQRNKVSSSNFASNIK